MAKRALVPNVGKAIEETVRTDGAADRGQDGGSPRWADSVMRGEALFGMGSPLGQSVLQQELRGPRAWFAASLLPVTWAVTTAPSISNISRCDSTNLV